MIAARAARRVVLLVTELASGSQWLATGDQAPLPEPALADGIAVARRTGCSMKVHGDAADYFLLVMLPPPRLVLVGAVHIAQALIPMARQCGYDVFLVDPRRAIASASRFPGVQMVHEWPDRAIAAIGPDRHTAVVTLSHDPKLDEPALATALAAQ